jgi:hypothetical protein
MTTQYQIAFWNLENLFDIQNSPRRSDKLDRAIGKSLIGWTQELLDKKIDQIVSIIKQMNSNKGPEIMGICEIENKYVLDLLVQALIPLGRNYNIAHHDMSDQRGIDVAFIYDADLFNKEAMFNHVVMRRTATRDILQVNFRTTNGNLLVVIGNHWPSRSGGEKESAGYRAIAGETLAYFHQRILEVHGEETPVLAMGDFNDEPSDPSLVDYALSTRSQKKVTNADIPRFFNFMWPLYGQAIGSLYFDNFPNVLDQFLGNKNILKEDAKIKALKNTTKIERFDEMIATGMYPRPIPFGGMGKPINLKGFSDHFPISIIVSEDY